MPDSTRTRPLSFGRSSTSDIGTGDLRVGIGKVGDCGVLGFVRWRVLGCDSRVLLKDHDQRFMGEERATRGLTKPATGLVSLQQGLLIVSLGLMAVALPDAMAQSVGNEWIGKRVVQKFKSFDLRSGDQLVDRKYVGFFYRVERASGPRLWLKAELLDLSGSANSGDLVPVDKAIEFFTGQIRDNPQDAFAYFMRARLWRDMKDMDRAVSDFDQAIRLEPADAIAYYNRGNAWLDKQVFDKAIADLTTSIRLDPKYGGAYGARAGAWRIKRQFHKAIQDYSDLGQIQPDNITGHRELARLLATCRNPKIRDGKRALTEANRACELTQWKDSSCLDTLAAACAETGDFPTAVKWQVQAIQHHPSDQASVLDWGAGFEGRLANYKRGKPTRE